MTKKAQWIIVVGIYCAFILFLYVGNFKSTPNREDTILSMLIEVFKTKPKEEWWESLPPPEYYEDRR